MLQKINIIMKMHYKELQNEIMSARRVLVTFHVNVSTKAVGRPPTRQVSSRNWYRGPSVREHVGWKGALENVHPHLPAGDRSDQ